MSDPSDFYRTRRWRKVRRDVLKLDNNECQICKSRHKHSPAEIVHHQYHLDDFPQFGLMIFVADPVTGERKRNLIAVCGSCHETVCHPEKAEHLPQHPERDPVTVERW